MQAAAEFNRLLMYAATAKRSNSREWLDGLAEKINAVLDATDDRDRVRVSEDGTQIELLRNASPRPARLNRKPK